MTQHIKDNHKTHDEDRNILTICSLVVWHQMAQSVCRKDAKTAATFRQRSAESVAKTWKKSVLPFCSKLRNGCFSPSCAGGKNLKISIILCYGCHNYHCYHDHHIILLYIEMRIGVFVFESSSLGREKPPPAADTNPYIFDQTQLSSAKYKWECVFKLRQTHNWQSSKKGEKFRGNNDAFVNYQ